MLFFGDESPGVARTRRVFGAQTYMRNAGLDLLRFVAIVLVLGRHLQAFPPDGNRLMHALVSTWQRGGWIGVDLFFVLSGFLVSGLLFKEYQARGALSIKRFLIRRGFKIYPAFWVFTFVSIALAARRHTLSARPVIGELLFLQNYVGRLWFHTWSLAVEEHFYVGLALLCFWFMEHRRRPTFDWIMPVFAVVAVTCLALRILSWRLYPKFDPEHHLFPTHLRVDSLFYGVLISYFFHFRPTRLPFLRWSTPRLLFCAACLLAAPFVLSIERSWIVPILFVIALYVGSGFALIAALRLPAVSSPILRLARTLGATSYSIYLWHGGLRLWTPSIIRGALGKSNWYVEAGCYLVGACVVGYAAARVVELPLLSLRDRLFPEEDPKIRTSG
jgi:peptidoglycan/LPS O-acetylase OafA/YrhL